MHSYNCVGCEGVSLVHELRLPGRKSCAGACRSGFSRLPIAAPPDGSG